MFLFNGFPLFVGSEELVWAVVLTFFSEEKKIINCAWLVRKE
jgi:hypothetical protein